MIRTILTIFSFIFAVMLAGCQKDGSTTATKSPPSSSTDHDEHDDKGNGGHDDHGPPMSLGSATVGGWNLVVTRDEGQLKAGGEAAIDCTITGGTGKVSAVRFWIGTEDAKGAIKALAAIEDPAEPNRWHTHAEIPSPFGADSKLWVEVEESTGTKHVSGFDLKR